MYFLRRQRKKECFFGEKGFCKEGFIQKIVSNMERKEKHKPSKYLVFCVKV
jgi:hypothetical protein